jgi:hypothetical protein
MDTVPVLRCPSILQSLWRSSNPACSLAYPVSPTKDAIYGLWLSSIGVTQRHGSVAIWLVSVEPPCPLDRPSWLRAGAEGQSYLLLLQVRLCETNGDHPLQRLSVDQTSNPSPLLWQTVLLWGDPRRDDGWSNIVD